MSRKLKEVLWSGMPLIILLLIVAATTVVLARHPSPTAKSGAKVDLSSNESSKAVVMPQKRTIAAFESELITITPHGFEPRQITRPQGPILLLIDNRSGLATVAPRLGVAGGLSLRELTIPREEPNWSDVLDLQPGVYLLTEANHPAWFCRLTITLE